MKERKVKNLKNDKRSCIWRLALERTFLLWVNDFSIWEKGWKNISWNGWLYENGKNGKDDGDDKGHGWMFYSLTTALMKLINLSQLKLFAWLDFKWIRAFLRWKKDDENQNKSIKCQQIFLKVAFSFLASSQAGGSQWRGSSRLCWIFSDFLHQISTFWELCQRANLPPLLIWLA